MHRSAEIVELILRLHGGQVSGQHIRKIACPECGRKDAFAYVELPAAIICAHYKSCGAITKTWPLFPELRDYEKKAPPTPDDPKAPARDYLESRGIRKSFVGLEFEYWAKTREGCGGAVMFPVPSANGSGPVYNGRLFNPPKGEGKTHNRGKTGGCHWAHPGRQYDPAEPVYAVEGIIDALSLWEMEKQAIALLTSGGDPSRFDLSAYGRITFAFDNDKAGKTALLKWKRHIAAKGQTFSAIMPDRGGDWNDFLLRYGSCAGEEFDKAHGRFCFNAALATAESGSDYGEIWFNEKGYPCGLFEFDGEYYHGTTRTEKRETFPVTTKVSDFIVRTRYFELNASDPDRPVNRYAVEIHPKAGPPTTCILTASDLSTPGQMTKAFLESGRACWEGTDKPTKSLIKKITHDRKAPIVRQVACIGYDHQSGCYIHPNFMAGKHGEISSPDENGFFKIKNSEYIRAFSKTIGPIRPAPKPKTAPSELWRLIHRAWPNNGPIALSWAVACLWVNQIKDELGFFPFLSLHGDPQTGKSNLTTNINRCFGIDHEGIPLRKDDTSKAVRRKISQLSGLPAALLETNEKSRVNVGDLVLTAYNKHNLQARARFSNDNQTNDIELSTSMMFVQNTEPFNTKQEKERVISLRFRKDSLNSETSEAFQSLKKISISDFPHMFFEIMKHRPRIEDKWKAEYETAMDDIRDSINDSRLTENFGLVLVFYRFLESILGDPGGDVECMIVEAGIQKRLSCSAREDTLADVFFSTMESMEKNSRGWLLCVDVDEVSNRLWFNLPGVMREMENQGFRIKAQVANIQADLAGHPGRIGEETTKHQFRFELESQRLKAWSFDMDAIGWGV